MDTNLYQREVVLPTEVMDDHHTVVTDNNSVVMDNNMVVLDNNMVEVTYNNMVEVMDDHHTDNNMVEVMDDHHTVVTDNNTVVTDNNMVDTTEINKGAPVVAAAKIFQHAPLLLALQVSPSLQQLVLLLNSVIVLVLNN